MKKVVLIAITVFASAIAQAAGFPIEGDWGTQMSNNGIQFDMTFSIHNNQLTLTNVCSTNGQSSTAHVTSPVTYDAATLTVLQNQQDDENGGGVDCNVSVQAAQMHYMVQGNLLTFSLPGQPDFTLTRK